nr:hypothetical protein [Tanacetum cinerariifolium]GFC32579.1 hypothetical protein [Tanacetum cinerariifolium]
MSALRLVDGAGNGSGDVALNQIPVALYGKKSITHFLRQKWYRYLSSDRHPSDGTGQVHRQVMVKLSALVGQPPHKGPSSKPRQHP